MSRLILLLAQGWLYSRLTIPTVPDSSAYMNYFVVEPQLGVLIGLWPSFHVNLNLNHYNIRYRVLPVLILLLFWLWPIGVQPFSGGGSQSASR